MGRLFGLLACLALIGPVGPASACINDNELPAHEREFRSQYAGPASPRPVRNYGRARSAGHWLLVGSGAGLLLGAFAVATTRRRARD